MKRFLIVALPRSRTAWLANFLTYDGSFCYHDLTVERHDPHSFCDAFDEHSGLGDRYRAMGSSDTGAILILDQVMEIYPLTKLVFVRRRLDDCYVSLCRMGLSAMRPAIELSAILMDRAIDKYRPMVVDYEKLDDINTARDIWEHCVGVGFNAQRFRQLANMRIDTMEDHRVPEMAEQLQEMARARH